MKYLFVFVISALALSSCNSRDRSDRNSNKSYQQTKMSLKDQELGNPKKFLKSDGTYRKNLLGQWVLEGKVSNYATVATYKDVVLEVKFYSKTKSLLGTENKTIYEFFKPGEKKSFKVKTYGYEGTKTIGWSIVKAKPAS
jgi:hypothetical protein